MLLTMVFSNLQFTEIMHVSCTLEAKPKFGGGQVSNNLSGGGVWGGLKAEQSSISADSSATF